MTNHETDIFIDTDGTKHRITGYSKPQLMTFKDASGEEHRIFMDVGTHERAYQLYMDENWDELKKFPTYVGQTHAKVDEAGRDDASGEKKAH